MKKQTTFPAMLAIALVLSFSLATAQIAPIKQWDKAFGGSSTDILYSLQQTADGGYILGGNSSSGISGDKTQSNQGAYDYWIVKTDVNGVKQWDKTFGGSYTDVLYSFQQTGDGGYILGGLSYSGISGDKTQASQGDRDYWIVKTDANGEKQWDKSFGGSSTDELHSLQQTDDGGYILGGWSFSGISGDKTQANQGSGDYWIVKTDENGEKQWDMTFGSWYNEGIFGVQQTADGGYILGGYSEISGGNGSYDYWMVKTDAYGVKQWDKTFGGSDYDILHSFQQTDDGGYILGGHSSSGISGDKTQASQGELDYWIIKINSNGDKQWDKTFGGSVDDLFSSLQKTADGGYILGGYSKSGISGDKTEVKQGKEDYWIVKTDANGVKQWDKTFGGGSQDFLYSLQQTADGGYILCGYSESGSNGDKTQPSQGLEDFWIVKVTTGCNGVVTVYADNDGDGHGDVSNSIFAVDCIAPDGYVFDSTDCNDANSEINPGACDASNGNGIDDNCDGFIDEGFGTTNYYVDTDGDGYGTGSELSLCENPGSGYSLNNSDCDDTNAEIYPGASEIFNGLDDNCNGIIDDGVCNAPTGLETKDLTATSVKFKWVDNPEASGYAIKYNTDAGGENAKVTYSKFNSKPISGLLPGTTYFWRVKSACSNDPKVVSEWSEKNYFTTTPLRMGDEQETSMEIYPNPASEKFMLDLRFYSTTNQPASIYIMNTLGQVVYSSVETVGNGELSEGLLTEKKVITMPSTAASGWYVVRVVMSDQVIDKKLLYQK